MPGFPGGQPFNPGNPINRNENQLQPDRETRHRTDDGADRSDRLNYSRWEVRLQMKVETQLARNASFEADYEWAGRSGIERAKWILALSSTGGERRWIRWAPNGPVVREIPMARLADVQLKGFN